MDDVGLIVALRTGALEPADPRWARFLSPARVEKMAALHSDEARRQSLGVELALAMCLAETGLPHSPPNYICDARGKPFLADGRACVSLSHASGLSVCALCAQPVGVDVEAESRDLARLEKRILDPKKRDEGGAVRVWVAKESYLKMTGDGISRDMRALVARRDRITNASDAVLAHLHTETFLSWALAASTPRPQAWRVTALTPDELAARLF